MIKTSSIESPEMELGAGEKLDLTKLRDSGASPETIEKKISEDDEWEELIDELREEVHKILGYNERDIKEKGLPAISEELSLEGSFPARKLSAKIDFLFSHAKDPKEVRKHTI